MRKINYFNLLLILGSASLWAQQKPLIEPPQAKVMQVQAQDIVIYENLPARLEASREALVQPQVGGIVQKRLFKEGAKIEAGQALYQIDDAMYQANLQVAQAKLAQAEASRALAESTRKRYAPLVKENAISKQTYDQAQAEVKVADANISAAKAAVKQAQINVDYAKVRAPISGILGRSFIHEGSLVSQATQMVKIQQLNPMHVNISQSASQLLRLKRQLAQTSASLPNQVHITFEDGSVYPHAGTLLFAENIVDAATGELLIRAEIPNPDNDLLPGLYVRVNVPQERLEQVFLVPQKAVVRGVQDTVNVVAADGSYQARPVKIARAYGHHWVIREGLQAGEMVMLDSVSNVSKMMGIQTVVPIVVTAEEALGQMQ